MAVEFGATLGNTPSSAGGTTKTLNIDGTVPAGSKLVVVIHYYGNRTVVLSGGGLAWTDDKTQAGVSDTNYRVTIASADVIDDDVEDPSLLATFSGSVDVAALSAFYITGAELNANGAVDVVGGAGSSTDGIAWSVGFETTEDDDLLIGAAFVDLTGQDVTPAGAAVEIYDVLESDGFKAHTIYQAGGTAGPKTLGGSWESGTLPWAAAAVAYKSAPSGLTELTSDQIQEPESLGVAQQYQRGAFTAAGRRWQFYSDGLGTLTEPKMLFTSTDDDGDTWATPTTIAILDTTTAVGSAYFDVHFDGTYVHYARGAIGTTSIFYRRGTPNSDGSITWSAVEQTVESGSSLLECSIAVDPTGHPWVAYESDTTDAFVTKSSTNDGTWSTDTGYPLQLSTDEVHWWTWIGSLGGGAMAAVYWTDDSSLTANENAIFCRVFDGSSWGSEELVDASLEKADGVSTNIAALASEAGLLLIAWGDEDRSQTISMQRLDTDSYNQESITSAMDGLALGFDPSTGQAHIVGKLSADSEALVHWHRSESGGWTDDDDIIATGSGVGVHPGGFQISERPYGGEFLVSVQRASGDLSEPIEMYAILAGDATVAVPPAGGVADVPAPTVSGSAGAEVDAPPAAGVGDVPSPTVAGTGGGQVAAPPGAGVGDVVAPSVSAGATVDAPPGEGAGDLPMADLPISADVDVPGQDDEAATNVGHMPAPSVTGTGDSSVDAPAAAGAGDVASPGVQAGARVDAVPADAVEGLVAPVLVAGAGVVAPPADASGDVPAPAEQASASVSTGPADGAGGAPDPEAQAGASVAAEPMAGVGDVEAPSVPTIGKVVSRTNRPSLLVPVAYETLLVPANVRDDLLIVVPKETTLTPTSIKDYLMISAPKETMLQTQEKESLLMVDLIGEDDG